ncbi:RING finger protein 17 [Melanerpes formicivorus]|uniref:RING finger protein 17 n=1 Tax=Melanerpes formicivorus TaxID=211600 RepID=UPI00358E3103
MSRKSEFALVDDGTGDLNRKLKAIRQCLKMLEEDVIEADQRKSDLCHTSKGGDVKALLDVKDEGADFLCSSSTKTKTGFEVGLCGDNSQRLARHPIHNSEEEDVQPVVSSHGASAADIDSKTMEDIDEALRIGLCNLSHLQDADKTLKYLKLMVNPEGEEVAETAERIFDELLASLLSRKKKLCAEIVKSISSYSADIGKAKEVVEEKKKCLAGAIRIAKELKITPSVRACCDLPQVICHLKLPVEAELSRVRGLNEKVFSRFFLNTDEIISLLENLGKMEWGAREHLERVKNTQVHHQNAPALPKSPFSLDIIVEEIIEDDPEKEEFPTECHADEQGENLFKELPFQHKTGSSELVTVSHVINPCHFYVQRFLLKKKAEILEKKLENFCCNENSYLLPSDVLELGAETFIKNKETGKWCRGTVTELIPLKSGNKKASGPKRCKIHDIALLEVFLVDFGSSVVLTSSGYDPTAMPEPAATLQTIETHDICLFVRKPDQHMEAELAAVPPLAVQCSLKDIVPKNASEGWGEEVKTQFLGMVKNKVVLMSIYGAQDGILIVDLQKSPFSKSDNIPASVKDALVFLDLARFRSQLPSHLEDNTVLQYSPPEIPQESEVVSVIVCHVNNPSDFYVLLEDRLDLLALSQKIQYVYRHEYGDHMEIFCPVEGQACIAKREDGNWYRAQITGLPSDQEVTVKYVDFGNVAHLTLKDIRRIRKEFLSVPEKAIRCKLAFIEPYEGTKEWNRKAKERFKEVTEDKTMLCSVVEILSNNSLAVELFNSSAVCGRNFSINCQLVEEDLASYIPGWTGGKENRRNRSKKAAKSLTRCTASTTVQPNETWDVPVEEIAETLEAVDEGDLKSLPEEEIQARITHVVSPSKIFIRWLSSERIMKSLQEEMFTIYKESEPQSVKWEDSMHCAVYLQDLKQWQRGQISRIVSETSAEVVLYDSGPQRAVDISCLRKLDENMKIIKTLAVECSLADIRPTGGSTQWTATACEYLSYYLVGMQVKIIIQESAVACALPVKILFKDETGKVTDISEHLVKKGLAFRNKRTDKADVTCSISKEYLEAHSEQENAQMNGCHSDTPHARVSTAPEGSMVVSESEQKSDQAHESPFPSGMGEMYTSPIIPVERIFQAAVSYVGCDGTIYIIPKAYEIKLKKLMTEIQSKFRCLGLLGPYHWKKGEACVVRGSDTMWYRGKVVEVGGSTLQVQYIDIGCTEKILSCHLYPTTLYTAIPPFCIPCQLYKTVPIGNFWQQDAVACLQELLTKEEVEIHVQELPDNPWGKLSISLYFGGTSLSSFMAYQKYCVAEDCEDISKQGLLEGDIRSFPSYVLPQLPVPGDTFPVRVTHLVSPKEVYICFEPPKNIVKQSDTEGDANCDSELESFDEALKWCNETVESLPVLTCFQKEMPCLVKYWDDVWYRAKLLSVEKLDPAQILVQCVDYGNFSVVPTDRLRHIPYYLMKYPVQAVRVLLAGFKPALYDENMKRIPYSPEWSMEALWAMMESVEGKQLSASILALSPEITVSLFGDDKSLIHMKLIEMGLAELDE